MRVFSAHIQTFETLINNQHTQQTEFQLTIIDDLPVPIQVDVYSGSENAKSTFQTTFNPTEASKAEILRIPFTSFTGSADFKNVTAMSLIVGPGEAFDCTVSRFTTGPILVCGDGVVSKSTEVG